MKKYLFIILGIGILFLPKFSLADTLGYTAIGSNNGGSGVYSVGEKIIATQNGTSTSASVYFNNLTTVTQFNIAIYSDNSGMPDTLLAQSATSSVGSLPGWQTVPITFSISSGTTYWVVSNSDDTVSIPIVYDNGGPINFAYDSSANNYPVFYNPWSGASSINGNVSIYLTYTPASNTPSSTPSFFSNFQTPDMDITCSYQYIGSEVATTTCSDPWNYYKGFGFDIVLIFLIGFGIYKLIQS